MKTKLLILTMLAGILFASCQSDKKHVLQIENPLEIQRKDADIKLSRNQIENHLGEIDGSQVPAPFLNNEVLPCQFDDLDMDGQWDEMVFLIDLEAQATESVQLKLVDENALPEFKTRTNLRLAAILEKEEKEYKELEEAKRIEEWEVKASKFQFEGPGWENDKVGFRNYFDWRSGMDIFGKNTDKMILDSAGINVSYHDMAWWGMDILKVAESLGAGALAIYYNDSLYRVTASDADYQAIVEGPVRSMFELGYYNMKVGDEIAEVNHQISITAGKFFYSSHISVKGLQKESKVVSGIVNMHDLKLNDLSSAKSALRYTYGKQSLNEDKLGMAILAEKNEVIEWFETPAKGQDITETYAVKMKNSTNDSTDFRFYAAWEMTDDRFKTEADFAEFMKKQQMRFENPVRIAFK